MLLIPVRILLAHVLVCWQCLCAHITFVFILHNRCTKIFWIIFSNNNKNPIYIFLKLWSKSKPGKKIGVLFWKYVWGTKHNASENMHFRRAKFGYLSCLLFPFNVNFKKLKSYLVNYAFVDTNWHTLNWINYTKWT